MKNFFLFMCGALFSFICANAQTGPGGVGNNSSNILWLRAGDLSLTDGAVVATWPDTSGNNYDATQTSNTRRPLFESSNADFNNLPSVTFDGNNDNMLLPELSNSASNYSIWFIYKSPSTSRQYLYEAQTGELRIPHEGGGDGAYTDGTNRGTEITGTGLKMVHWDLNSSGASIYEDGTQTQSSLSYTQRALEDNVRLGSNDNGSSRYFEGDFAEAIFYNTTLNSAQRILVENYLGNKYNISIPSDYYSFQTTHGYDLAGIGRVNSSNEHTAAESAKMLRVSSASSLGDGDYLLFGHNSGSISSWTTSEIPGSDMERINREWILDETGDVGTVTISIDTTFLPAKTTGYTKYVLWVDADGDFSSGATQHVLTLNGGRYEKTSVDINDGDYISLGILKPVVRYTATSASGSEATSPVAVNISMNYALPSNVNVNYVVTGGTATGSGTDYTLANGTATITTGNTSTSYNIAIVNDAIEESDETIVVKLRNPTNGTSLHADSTYTYTINDNDAVRKIEFQTTASSGGEATSIVNVTVRMNLVDAIDTTSVNYSVSGGTATGSGTDFTLANGTAIINPGDTTTTFSIAINNDALDEENETIIITLSNSSSNANVGTNSTYTYTINDDDATPTVAFNSASSSANEGTTNPEIQVSLSAVSGRDVTVDYSVTGGTATGSGTDYSLSSGTLTITAGNSSGNISPTVVDDNDIELAETILLEIANPGNATLGGITTHTFTITDNDNLGSIGPGGVGDETSNILWLRAEDITSVADGGNIATWTDISGNAHNATQGTNGDRPNWDEVNANFNDKPTVTFNGSADWLDLDILTHAASDYDVFFVYREAATDTRQYLFNAQTGTLILAHRGSTNERAYSDGSARGTEITGTAAQIVEWQLDDAGSGIFINGASNQSGLTYVQRAIGGNVSLGANTGGSSRFFEGDIAEVIFYNKNLNSAQRVITTNYLAAKYGLAISNDIYAFESTHENDVAGIGSESLPNVHTEAYSAGIMGIGNASSLDNGDYLLFGHDAGSITTWTTTEIPGSDMERIAREWIFDETGDVGTITISLDTSSLPAKTAGYTKYVLWIDSDGDFSSGATQHVLTLNGGRYEAAAVSVNDGDHVTFGILKPVIQYAAIGAFGSEATSPVTVNINLNYALPSSVSVNYVVTGGTATGSGTDYTLANGTATITAGSTSTSYNIVVVNDALEENDETIIVKLRNPTNGVSLHADSTYTLTINDNDAPRKIEFQTTAASGSESATAVNVTVRANLVDAVDTISVSYTVTGGTATGSGMDYTLANGTAKINPGDTTTTFSITVNNDALDEDDETITIALSNSSSNANVGTNANFTYTINDDDSAPSVYFNSAASSSGEGTTNPAISVSLSAVSGKDVTVDYAVTGGTATGSGTDYTLADGTLTITAGNSTGNISPTIVDDSNVELDETITLEISNPTNATLGSQTTHTFTISDDDNLGPVGPGGVGDDESNILWLRAGDITGVADGGNITTWSDISGNGHNATQGTVGDRPNWDQVNANFNNHPSVTFNGTTDWFDLDALTNAASDYDIFMVYRESATTSRQYLFEAQTGAIRIAHRGSTNERAYYDGTARGSEITGTTTQMVEWQLDDAGASVYINGTQNQTGLTYTQRAIGGNVSLGANTSGGSRFFDGNIAEVVMFNKALNSAQRILITNYLAAKYELTISNDKYAYQATHANDVSGIGSEALPNVHTEAYSGGIVGISNASSLDNGDYLLFGHNGGSIASWTASESPITEITRIAREWRLDETGDVGTLTISLDTTLLPARSGGYNGYVLMVDADGNFSTGATLYPLSLVSGSIYKADNVAIADGDYISFGTGRYVSATTGNFNATSTWLANAIPGSGQNVFITKGTNISLAANQTIGSLTVLAEGTLNIGSYTLSINSGTITNGGTINFGTGTVNFSAAGTQSIPAFTYNSILISGSNTKTLAGNITVNGNLSISSGTLDINNTSDFSIDLKGNWINSGGTFNAHQGTVTFSGSSEQSVTSNSQSFYNLEIDNTATGVMLNDNVTVSNILSLSDGVVTTNGSRIIITNSSAAALTGYSSSSFINGNLRRYIASNLSTYAFPVGNGTGSSDYYLAEMQNALLTGPSYIDGSFGALQNHDDEDLDASDGSLIYTEINPSGVWTLEPNSQPTLGTYNIRLYIENMNGLEDNEFGVLKRPTGSSSGADWTTGGGLLNALNGSGRLVSDGFMLRTGLTSFSEFGAGQGSNSGGGLPIELLSFTAETLGDVVELKWITATEINNDFFTVERSQNGVEFEELNVFEGAGNSSQTRHYQTFDRIPFEGISYYRLKQTDFDGAFTYSDIVSVSVERTEPPAVFTLFPNPVSGGKFFVKIENHPGESPALVDVFDMNGKQIFSKEFPNATEQIEVPLPEYLRQGVYLVVLRTGKTTSEQRIVIN